MLVILQSSWPLIIPMLKPDTVKLTGSNSDGSFISADLNYSFGQ